MVPHALPSAGMWVSRRPDTRSLSNIIPLPPVQAGPSGPTVPLFYRIITYIFPDYDISP